MLLLLPLRRFRNTTIAKAAANIKLVMRGIHRYKGSPEIQHAVENLVVDYKELLDQSLSTKTKLLSDN